MVKFRTVLLAQGGLWEAGPCHDSLEDVLHWPQDSLLFT